MEANARRKPNLTNTQRRAVIEFLLSRVRNPDDPAKLVHGTLKEAAIRFEVTSETISQIWRRALQSKESGSEAMDVSSRMAGRVGRKKKEFDIDALKAIPFRQRRNMRSIAAAMGTSKDTVQRAVKAGLLEPHTNAIKPYLTDANKVNRVKFCLSMLDHDNPAQFQDMMNTIHIDEKWFYITEQTSRFYLAPGEEPPQRTCKSKRFITKVMFMAAVVVPRFDTGRNCAFDGKIGIFPFIFQEPAKRSSKNRQAGTLETKCITSIDKFETRKMLSEQVLPAIRATWPLAWEGQKTSDVIIQLDNAKPHVLNDDPNLAVDLVQDGMTIKLMNQPPNSPDMNVLDLGFFRAIQSLQHQQHMSGIDDLIAATKKAYQDLPVEKLTNIFLTWQQCMIEVIKLNGDNKYKVPHIGKDGLRRRSTLPSSLVCPDEVRLQGFNFVNELE